MVASGTHYILFRSNEFETEVTEVFKGGSNSLYYIQEPCEDISFSKRGSYATVVLSCPKFRDVIIHISQSGTEHLKRENVRFSRPSTLSSVAHIDKGIAVMAKTV